jgi:hypothetical protein
MSAVEQLLASAIHMKPWGSRHRGTLAEMVEADTMLRLEAVKNVSQARLWTYLWDGIGRRVHWILYHRRHTGVASILLRVSRLHLSRIRRWLSSHLSILRWSKLGNPSLLLWTPVRCILVP